MKHVTLTILISLTTLLISNAQFDSKFYFPSKEWNEIENLKYEEFFYQIKNDTLHSILFKVKKPKATIIFYHGAGGNISTYQTIIRPLVEANYQVFSIDFRGYGKSTGTPSHLNIASDAQFIFNQILSSKWVTEKVIIYGASMGTQIATKIANDNQDRISGLVLDGSISSFTDMALLYVPEEQKTMISQYVTSPYSAKENIKSINNTPKLFIHSKQDKSVPFSQGLLVFNNAQEPKSFWEYEGNHLDACSKLPDVYILKINSLIQ